MDLLGTCNCLASNPLYTAITTVNQDIVADKDKLVNFGQVAGADRTHRLYNVNGSFKDDILLEYNDASYAKHFGSKKSIEVKVDKTIFTLKSIFHELITPTIHTPSHKPDSHAKSFTRKIKHFSGKDVPGPGECAVGEWLVLAQDVVEYDSKLSSQEKLDFLRSTLVGDALQLLSSCLHDISDGQALIDLISRTYGGQISSEQLEYEFRLITQLDREKPSIFWARLQNNLVKWEKSQKAPLAKDKLRLQQFVWGLCPQDNDLLTVRLGLKGMTSADTPPQYGTMLEKLQNVERERRERQQRAGNNKVRSGLLVVDDCSAELDDLTLKVSQLAVQSSASAAPVQVEPSAAEKVTKPVKKPFQKDTGGKHRRRFSKNQKKPCWNCGSLKHHMPRCPEPFNADRVKASCQNFKNPQAEKPLNSE